MSIACRSDPKSLDMQAHQICSASGVPHCFAIKLPTGGVLASATHRMVEDAACCLARNMPYQAMEGQSRSVRAGARPPAMLVAEQAGSWHTPLMIYTSGHSLKDCEAQVVTHIYFP